MRGFLKTEEVEKRAKKKQKAGSAIDRRAVAAVGRRLEIQVWRLSWPFLRLFQCPGGAACSIALAEASFEQIEAAERRGNGSNGWNRRRASCLGPPVLFFVSND